jgi:hypothetical protein
LGAREEQQSDTEKDANGRIERSTLGRQTPGEEEKRDKKTGTLLAERG